MTPNELHSMANRKRGTVFNDLALSSAMIQKVLGKHWNATQGVTIHRNTLQYIAIQL